MPAAPSIVLVRSEADRGARPVADGAAPEADRGARPVADGAAPELVRLLGPERSASVTRTLQLRAASWAESVAPGRVRAARPVDLEEVVLGALESGGPLLVAWPRLSRWLPDHAAAALGDLAAGCDVSIGPVFAGGAYLLALARLQPELLALVGPPRFAPDALGPMLDAVQRAGVDVGLLRGERGLCTAADVHAALADPLLDDELRVLLS